MNEYLDGAKGIVLYQRHNSSIGCVPISPKNKVSYQLTKSFIQEEFLKDPLFFSHPSTKLIEYNKRFADGNYGSEFLLETMYKTIRVREINQGIVVEEKKGSYFDFNSTDEEYLMVDDSCYIEEIDLLFIDYSKRIKSIIEELNENIMDCIPYRAEGNELVSNNLRCDTLFEKENPIMFNWQVIKDKKSSDITAFADEDVHFSLKHIILWDFTKYFKFPELVPINNSTVENPLSQKYLYEGASYWIAPSPFGVNGMFYSDDKASIKEEIYLYPSLQNLFACEYLGISNRKRCDICNRLLPVDYQGTHCSKEYDADCRRKYDRMRKVKEMNRKKEEWYKQHPTKASHK